MFSEYHSTVINQVKAISSYFSSVVPLTPGSMYQTVLIQITFIAREDVIDSSMTKTWTWCILEYLYFSIGCGLKVCHTIVWNAIYPQLENNYTCICTRSLYGIF